MKKNTTEQPQELDDDALESAQGGIVVGNNFEEFKAGGKPKGVSTGASTDPDDFKAETNSRSRGR